MDWSLRQIVVAGLAVLGGLALYQYVRGQGGAVATVLNVKPGDLALKRHLSGAKAVAESAKAAKEGPETYRDKKASESMVKS